MIVRLYFNAKEEWPLVWSVDQGSVATERKVASVRVDGMLGVTVFERHSEERPKAWLEYANAAFTIRGDAALIHGSRLT